MTTSRRYTKEEIARRGKQIYERVVRPTIKAKDTGKFVAIDIDSEAFAVSNDELKACDRLHALNSDAQLWLMRIGSRSAYDFGAVSADVA
jgi:hypothetical protein